MSDLVCIRVMLVDDHAVARAGYRFLLDNLPDITVVGEAGSGEAALTLYPIVMPDVVILDLTMPGIGGRETLVQLQSQWPQSRILICTMHETAALVNYSIAAGAAGYISKNSSPEVLVAAVRKIAQGEQYIDADLQSNLVTSNDRASTVGFASLSPREFQIICMFAEAQPLDEIAAKLSISTKTVANNLTVIKEKLQVDTTAELVRLTISAGLASA
jgi:two-component system, NarL family, invasion response regulator UvrY